MSPNYDDWKLASPREDDEEEDEHDNCGHPQGSCFNPNTFSLEEDCDSCPYNRGDG